MNTAEARVVLDRARASAEDMRRVYPNTPEFAVLLRFNPIGAHEFRKLTPRQLWFLLTNFTDVHQEVVETRPPTTIEWALFSRTCLWEYSEITELWRAAKPVMY